MKNIVLLLIILLPALGFSQSICNSVIATSGSYYANGQTSVDWTLGEPMIYTYSNANISITQGFQQTQFLPVFIPVMESNSSLINIYPNPANDFLFIKISDNQVLSAAKSQVTVSIHSMIGNKVSLTIHPLLDPILKIDLNNLAPSTYIVFVSFENHKESFVFTKL
jgi:hypothetical protein